MQRVAGGILLRLRQKYHTDWPSPSVAVAPIGVHEPRLRQRGGIAAYLHRRLPKVMPIHGGVATDQAVSAHNAGFDGLAGLHDRKQRDHAAQRKIDLLDRGSLLVEHGIRLQPDRTEPRLTCPPLLPLRWGRDLMGYWTRRIAPAAETQ